MTSVGLSLSALVEQTPLLQQVRKSDLRSGDCVFVRTTNSLYSIRVLEGGYCVVSGGWFARKGLSPTRTTIVGCTWGGTAVKVDIVAACGLRLEFGNRLITSTIRKIFVLPAGHEN